MFVLWEMGQGRRDTAVRPEIPPAQPEGFTGNHVLEGRNSTEVHSPSHNGQKCSCDTEIVKLSGFSTGNLFWSLEGGLLNLPFWKELLMISLHGYQCPGPNAPSALGLLISSPKQMQELIKEAEPVFFLLLAALNSVAGT